MQANANQLSKEEAVALNDVAMTASFFPIFIMFLVALIITIIGFLIIGIEPIEHFILANDSFVLFVLIALVLNALMFWLTAKFLVAKSLFKPRKKGALVLLGSASFSNYIIKWATIAFVTSTVLGFIIIAVEMLLNITLPAVMGALSGFCSAYIANHIVANKMISNNDAKIELKVND